MFFHGHLFCDYRHIYHDKTTVFNFPEEPLDIQEIKNEVLKFLTKYISCNWLKDGILLVFNDIDIYRGNNDYDMLMFDFD